MIDTNSKELKLEDIPIACEFKNVFPKDLPGLLPDREVEFSINVVPGTAPISQVPYKMAPTELKKLKIPFSHLKMSLMKSYC